MKLHILLVNAVADALADIFQNGKYADKVIERLLKSNSKWGSRDRAFIAETTYECVRWLRMYDALSPSPARNDQEFDVMNYTKDDFIQLVGVHLVLKAGENIDFPLFKNLDYTELYKRSEALSDRKVKNAIPNWLDSLGEKELGNQLWEAELFALNKPAQIVLRCNTLKTTVSDVQKKLNDINIDAETTPLSIDALVLKKRAHVASTELYKKGYFEVQDAGSQLIAPFLQVEGGMYVIDACAGTGGKSLHLAALMNNSGTLIAMDTEGHKLEELRKRAQRNSINIIETRTIESPKVISRFHNTADGLLLDVPCSGLGVLRRNPDTKWKLKPEFLDIIRATQAQIIQNYSKMVKIGGKMVYATCSILPSENQNQVATFLDNNRNWKMEEDKTITAHADGFDGFYMTRLKRLS